MLFSKWEAIAIMVIALTVSCVVAYTDYNSNSKAKSGLEECPNFRSNNSTDTIWVKDCKEFTESYFKHNKVEE